MGLGGVRRGLGGVRWGAVDGCFRASAKGYLCTIVTRDALAGQNCQQTKACIGYCTKMTNLATDKLFLRLFVTNWIHWFFGPPKGICMFST